jgi:RND superfamily putative drug exporter
VSTDLRSPIADPHDPAPAPAREEPDAIRSQLLYRWGVAVARRRRLMLIAGACLLVLCAGLYPALQHAVGAPNPQVQGSESVRTEQILARSFPEAGREDDALAFYSRSHLAGDRVYRRAIASVVTALRHQPGVRRVLSPYDTTAVAQISSDEHAAFAVLVLTQSTNQRFNNAAHLQDVATRAAGASGVQTFLTGASPVVNDLGSIERADTAQAEAIGLPVALLILLLATGSLVAASLPLLVAICGLLLTDGALAVVASVVNIDATLLAIVAMLGLGIGIDYALFVTDRFREELALGERASGQEGGDQSGGDQPGEDQADGDQAERVADAVGLALATSGRTILFSGAIMVASLSSLLVVRMAFCRELAGGALLVVASTLLVAMTLLPALLALLGPRINRGALPARLQPASVRPQHRQADRGGWARWTWLVMRRPVIALGVSVALLLIALTPVFGIRYGIDLGVLSNSDTNSGRGEQVLKTSFAPGLMAPIQIVVSGGHSGKGPGSVAATAKTLGKEIEADPRVNAIAEDRKGNKALVIAVTSVRVDSPAATALVRHIRNDLAPRVHANGGPTVLVGGLTAGTVDISNEMRTKLPVAMLLTFVLSMVLLLVVFRSIVLPIKAMLMNLLSVGATVGIVVFVFQDGHGQRLLGFTSTGFIQALIPLIVFAVLFGLSMDYEVFLIRRVQEEWHKTHDNSLAVATGVQRTARPITAAAAIMVAIFGSFLTAGLLEVKQLGFALALAVALDATLIRLVLGPALMRLFGVWNWWLPARLARILPGGEEG